MAAPLSFRDYTLLEEGDMIPCGPVYAAGHLDTGAYAGTFLL